MRLQASRETAGVRCPKHPDARVWRDGYYGRDAPGQFRRQRYKCAPPLGDRHVFTEPLPRRVVATHECDVCERLAPAQEGPRTPRRYQFTLWEVAQGLALVGAGASYRSASAALRREINRPARRPRYDRRFSTQPHLLEDWVEVFAPVINDAFPELTWPSVIAVDEVPFAVRTGQYGGRQRFVVLGAIGYPHRRICLLQAVDGRSAGNWESFFRSLHGRPTRLVCDGSTSIRSAAQSVWGAPDTPLIWISHHHLVGQIVDKLPAGSPMVDLAQTALHGLSNWHEFVEIARDYRVPRLHAWIDANADLVERQLAQPLHPMSTGALEEKLASVKNWLEDRRGTFKNKRRTDRLLMLMRNQLNGHASPRTYHRILQEHVRSSAGTPTLTPRAVRDRLGYASLVSSGS